MNKRIQLSNYSHQLSRCIFVFIFYRKKFYRRFIANVKTNNYICLECKKESQKKHRTKAPPSIQNYVRALNHPESTQLILHSSFFILKHRIILEWFSSDLSEWDCYVGRNKSNALAPYAYLCIVHSGQITHSHIFHSEHREWQLAFHFLFIFSWIVFCLGSCNVRCDIVHILHLHTTANIRMLGESNLKQSKNVIGFA